MEREGAIRLTISNDREHWQRILERRPDAARFEGFLGAEVEVDLASARLERRHRGHELFVEVTRASGQSAMVPVRIVQTMAGFQFGLDVFAKMFRQAFGHDNRTPRDPSTRTQLTPLL